MTEVKAILRYARVSPRKTRMLVDLLRGKKALVAEEQLIWLSGKPAVIVLKLLRSAMANAINNSNLVKESLVIKSIMVDGGPVLKRFTPKAFGRGTPIRKPTSHISLVLVGTAKNLKLPKEEIKVADSKPVTAKKDDKKEVLPAKTTVKHDAKAKVELEKKKNIKKSAK
jgi:large subunit ribosomal protein L22